jgi:ATP-dependent helicase/nuclease subunit A
MPPAAAEEKRFRLAAAMERSDCFEREWERYGSLLRSRLEWSYPHAAESARRSKYSVTELLGEGGQESLRAALPRPRFLETERLDAARRGTVLHTVLERIPFTEAGKSPAEIRAFAEELQRREILSEAEAAAVDAEKIAAFFASDLGRRACRSGRLRRETPFTLRTETEDGPALVQGIIDCYFEEEDGCVLLDYKSNRIGPEGPLPLVEHYRPQLELYRSALAQICGLPVKESWLVLLQTGEAFPI